ncbi:MAG: alpha/beta hydrolase family protein [Actinobacteria bacterium]|nr:alpha/beta hydrolase family protein [Actinomycetota bacterium]
MPDETAAQSLATMRSPSLAVQLTSIVQPLWRTIGYLSPGASSRRAARYAPYDVPAPGASPRLAAHVFTDEMCLAAFKLLRKPPTAEAFQRIESEVDDALVMFRARGWLDEPASYIGQPPPLVEPLESGSVDWPVRVHGLEFPSEWEPHEREPGRERWLSYEANRTARAYVLRHGDERPRSWLVCLHGTAMGRPEVDPMLLRAKHFYNDLGLNVVLPILPLHGARGGPRSWDVQFPTVDVLDNVHGLAQSAWDVRRLLSWIRTQNPSGIAVTGLSLGGYVAALVAALEPLDCVIAGMPAVDFPRVLRRHTPREIRNLEDFQLLGEKTDELHRAVSPLTIEPATAHDHRFIYAGTVDRLIDPVEQTVALWEHWNRPTIKWVHAGHVGHLVLGGGIGAFVDDSLGRSLPLG